MPWVCHQRSGTLIGPNGQEYTGGYSGKASTSKQSCCRGRAFLRADPARYLEYRFNSSQFSPNWPEYVDLTPQGHNAHGRRHFRIHGNNRADDASTGCIVASPQARQAIINSGDTTLEVRPSCEIYYFFFAFVFFSAQRPTQKTTRETPRAGRLKKQCE